ncbi:MAG: ABC transporter permease [Armatimonadetes bacterium]|nr:ABC transporter permease [Armatimonadota bacterium]
MSAFRRRPVSLLTVKVWRDAAALGSTSLALVLLMAIGCCLYVLFAQARLNLEGSYRDFYGKHHFADVTVQVDEAPESLTVAVGLIPGVREVMGRAVKDGTIVLRDRPRRRVVGRFIGVPGDRRPALNDIAVLDGRYLRNRGECVLSRMFAEANDIRVGAVIQATYLGRQRDFAVVGLAVSPEYLYPAASKEQTFVSPGTFGICWIDADTLRQWTGLNRVITEVHMLCDEGTSDRVLQTAKDLCRRYGLRSWWDQVEQPSNRMLAMDLVGFRAMSVAFPFLFMFAAALSMFSSLSRIVRLQTGVVGFLRASGLDAREVGWHYVWQGALLTGAGAVPGAVLGHLMSLWMTGLYAHQLHLPTTVKTAHWVVIIGGIVVSGVVGFIAAWRPARAAAATPPAVAMRGDRSDDVATPGLNWLMRLTRHLPVLQRIAARGLLRRPSRTLLAVGGLTCGASLLIATFGLYTSIRGAIQEWVFDTLQFDLQVMFTSAEGSRLAEAVGGMAGVRSVSRSCGAPVNIRSTSGEVTVVMVGYERGQRHVILNLGPGRQPDLAPGLVYLPRQLGRKLHVEAGDPLEVEWSYASRSKRVHSTMRVGGVLDLTFGGMAYTNYQDLRRRIVDRVYPTGEYSALIACEPAMRASLRQRLERDEQVAAVLVMDDLQQEVEQSLRITIIFISVLLAFGAILSGAVLHSVSSISIHERMRELATLRSLGFSAAATTTAAAVEVYFMALLGLLAGLPLGKWMNYEYMKMFETDTMSFKQILPVWAYLAVVGIVVGLVALSLREGVARLRTMDLAQATKARD